MSEPQWFGQPGYRCRLEWGRRGAESASARGDVLVVVDVLSFSTAVVTAAAHDVCIYPCLPEERDALAERVGAERAVRRSEVPSRGRFSLSPLTYVGAEPGARVALPSPNGSTCCTLARGCPTVLVGCLLNAAAVARYVAPLLEREGHGVTVLACGERWRTAAHGEDLRFAVEDYLAAGAILAGLPDARSPEAEVCALAFRAIGGRLEPTLLSSGSGLELVSGGYEEDVRHAARLDLYGVVPVLGADGSLQVG